MALMCPALLTPATSQEQSNFNGYIVTSRSTLKGRVSVYKLQKMVYITYGFMLLSFDTRR